MSALRSHISSLILVTTAMAIGGAGSYWFASEPPAEVARTPVVGERDQLVLVFFGESTCGVCLRPETIAAIPEVKASLARVASQNELDFTSIGVALDYDIEAGIGYLDRLGGWDQISVGLEQLNSVALHTMSPSATPDLIVLRRNVSTTTGGPKRMTSLTAQKVLVHKAGLGEIRRWLTHGTPIPGLEVAMK